LQGAELPTVGRQGLRVPSLAEAPNIPQDFNFLGTDTASWLNRAFPCTSTTRPTGVADGFLIRETDTDHLGVYNGTTSTWTIYSATGSGGGGGGGTFDTAAALYEASAAQPISTGIDTVVAFGVQQTADPEVTRSPQGAGHQFTLLATRNWSISTTTRFAQHPAGGRTFELRTGAGKVLAKASGPVDTDAPWTCNLAVSRRLPINTTVFLVARHNAGTGISLEPNNGDTCHIDLTGV
jgi:hypothetical protein